MYYNILLANFKRALAKDERRFTSEVDDGRWEGRTRQSGSNDSVDFGEGGDDSAGAEGRGVATRIG